MCMDCETEFEKDFKEHQKECPGDCKVCQAVKREKELGIYGAGPAERAYILGL